MTNLNLNLFNINYVKENYKEILNIINQKLNDLSIDDKNQKLRLEIIYILKIFIENIDLRQYMLIGSIKSIPENIYYESLFTLGTLYKIYVENELNIKKILTIELENLYKLGLFYFLKILQFKINDKNTLLQITSIYSYLVLYSNKEKGLEYMLENLLYDPTNPIVHYNLGFIYYELKDYKNAMIYFKISIKLLENAQSKNNDNIKDNIKDNNELLIKNYYQLSLINESINILEALNNLLNALKINLTEPVINNQLGLIYTELRRTDLAKKCYLTGIKNYKNTIITLNYNEVLSNLYINYGHMNTYNGNPIESINYYDKVLEISSNTKAFNNKMLNLTYLFNIYKDKDYIIKEHKLANKFYPKIYNYTFSKELFKSEIIIIGFISGDFINHPVSYFINTFLKNYNNKKFKIYCFVESKFNKINNSYINYDKINYINIQNKSTKEVTDFIYNNKIHILFDLSGHTAYNRLDIFANKPSPIQISYIGYPFTTGLNTIDYRITDEICDGDLNISQNYYTEKLIKLPNCFLCYDPINYTNNSYKIPEINNDFLDNDIYLGCFNRLNKMNDNFIDIINNILIKFQKIKIVFKTKALLNKDIKIEFLKKFNTKLINRIIILDCTISHDEHLLIYNKIHFAIDTFPYSGTTTTCEALYMGVPVISFYDSTHYYHPHNVSCSILKNSNLEEYIIDIKQKKNIYNIISKLLKNKNNTDWIILKKEIRNKFLNGFVCNKKEYLLKFENLLINLYNNYKLE